MKLPIALPLMLAPMAGGPTSPELLAAVTAAGAGGFLPGGYLTAAQLEGRLGELSDRMVAAGL
ncbi:MAG: nitronate monooxygenase, partial [Luteococcus japonicus]